VNAQRRLSEKAIELAFLACAALSVLTTAGIVLVLAVESFGFFREVNPLKLIFDTQWTPLFADKHYGIWPLLSGTFVTSAVAIGVALPFGLLAAIYLSELAHARTRRFVKPALEVLAGVPTIVYGYFALVVVTPALQKIIPGLSGFNALSAGLIMGVMITPMISSLSEDALFAVPDALREGALGLGASQLATIFKVVLPAARSGVAAATLLAAGRAVGETMIVAIAAGQQPRLGLDPRESVETMTAYIVKVSMGDTPAGSLEHRTLFVVGGVLFVFTLGINLLSRRVVRGRAK
jgi:phosphate transport system permease protein